MRCAAFEPKLAQIAILILKLDVQLETAMGVIFKVPAFVIYVVGGLLGFLSLWRL
jgi:hypothetical protein